MTIALLHGWCFDRSVWQPLQTHLPNTLALDLPGYGEAAAQAAQATPDTLDALTDAVLAQLPAQVDALVGWSLGALVALNAAARAPQRIGKLILLGATASFVQRTGWPHAVAAPQLADFSAELQRDPAALFARFALISNQGDAQARALVRQLRALPQPSTTTLAAGLAILGSADLRPLLPQIHQPTLLLHGERDPLMPLAAAEALAAALPQATQATVRSFANVAHAPHLAEAATCAAAIQAFMERPA